MFCDKNDEKLYALKPVVVLERLEFPSRIDVQNVVPPSDQFNTDLEQISHDQTQRRKIFREEKPWSQTTNFLSKSSRVNQRRSGGGVTKSSVQVPEKKNTEDDRPHRCPLCGEGFHTSVLLAVHKRIHIDSEEDSEDVDDVDEIDSIHDTSFDKALEDSSAIKHDGIPHTSSKEPIRNIHKAIVDNPPSNLNNKINDVILESKDPIAHPNGLSPDDQMSIMNHREHDYAQSAKRNPGLMKKIKEHKKSGGTTEEKRQKKKGSTRVKEIFSCDQCPASFSHSWYLQLHMTLLHYIHKKNTFLNCPGCSSRWKKEDDLRHHIKGDHYSDYLEMNLEISTCLRNPTDALTGENIKLTKKKPPSQRCPPKPICFDLERIACDWDVATPSERDEIMELVETELRYIVIERNKFGDHFTYTDIKRLAPEIAKWLRVCNFHDAIATKRWAQKVLSSVGQPPRPGKFRFIHNYNTSYLNAVNSLSSRGLSESTVFYTFEFKLCSVKGDQIVQIAKPLSGASSSEVPELKSTDTVSVILSTNANGTVLLYPVFIYKGKITNHENIHKTVAETSQASPKELIENPHFGQWFTHFLVTIPNTRPVLFLVEGDVSLLSYNVVVLARTNDVHIVFLPSRNRFVHPHQLIRESLASPLVESFEREVVRFMESHNTKSVHMEHFGSIFNSAWKSVPQKLETSKSFLQSGLLPLPLTTRPLEQAVKEYLNGVRSSQQNVSGTVSSHSDTQSNKYLPTQTILGESIITLEKDDVKLEAVEETCQDNSDCLPQAVKEEPEECILPDADTHIDSTLEVKEEPIDYTEECTEEPEKLLPNKIEELKCEFHCANCNDTFHSSQDLTEHICAENITKSHSCSICEAEFFTVNELVTHCCNPDKRNSVDCNLHTCQICNMSFALKKTLDFHLLTHGNNRNVAIRKDLLEKSPYQQSSDASRYQLNPTTSASSSSNSAQRIVCKRGGNILEDHEVPSKPPKLVYFGSEDTYRPQTSPALSTSSRTISPLSTSSRTISPSSSISSRTLTASPNDLLASDDDTFVKKSAVKRKAPLGYLRLLPPPLPEHDYFGQVYKKPSNSKLKAFAPRKTKHKFLEHELFEEKSQITISSLISSSHKKANVLSRKQTRKAIRRIQLICAESKLSKREKKGGPCACDYK